MFGLFKKKTEAEKLQEKYEKLMEESFILSKINRMQSDKKLAEATSVLQEIELLET